MEDANRVEGVLASDARSVDDDRPFEMWRRRLDKTPSGAPQHPAALKILKLYCTAAEADFLSRMPAKFSSLPQLAGLYRKDIRQTSEMLERLIDKFLVGDLDCGHGVHVYTPMQFIPGFWDLTFMRIRDDLPMAEISELFQQYWDTFYPEVLGHGKPTQDFRIMVREQSLPETYTEILDYERTSHIIKTAKRICVGQCGCSSMRLQASKPVCDRPLETCMSLNAGADAVLRAGQGRQISATQAMNIIDDCKAHNMVQCADNVQREPWYMCNCCRCCCSLFKALRTYDVQTTVVSSGFIAEIDSEACDNCGRCVEVCPVGAIERGQSFATVDQGKCLGCGVCAARCPGRAIELARRPRRVYTPDEYNEKALALALERGKLADQLFYDPNKRSHRSLSALSNAILKMPPVKQALAVDALRRRFVRSIARAVVRDLDKTVQKEKERLAGAGETQA